MRWDSIIKLLSGTILYKLERYCLVYPKKNKTCFNQVWWSQLPHFYVNISHCTMNITFEDSQPIKL